MRLLSAVINFFARILNKLLVRSKVLPVDPKAEFALSSHVATFYIGRLNSRTDLAALAAICRKHNLPNPTEYEQLNGQVLPRFIGINNPPPLFGNKTKKSNATEQAQAIIDALDEKSDKPIQVIPVTILWGRNPGKEKPGLGTLVSHSLTPSWFRKFFVLLFSGRDNFIRFSQPFDLNELMNSRSEHENLAHKLIRVASVHFRRQKRAATGPKLPSRDQLFSSILASSAIKKAIADEAKSKNISQHQAKQNALNLLDEIAANYSDAMIRVADRIMTWLWNRLYNGIEVNGANKVQELTNKGHEIIYMPCHRSHMDYLLLTYVIYHQGLVPPHIAAGINLNFFPAGGIFRRSGAFFIRRSFSGNKLYSAVFKEYLSQLFVKGYSVKFYTEGGRSRTGRLLPPKTGMLAMTLQAMLRGVERPVSIVPVYIGYEHVMEINTYLKELAGNNKKNESVLGIFKAIKNLKNYGRGYVNFGEPLNINQFLNQQQPNWHEFIHPTETQKPAWLGTQVANLANEVMIKINNGAALNAINLLATILLTNEQCALGKSQLLTQLRFYLNLQQQAQLSNNVTLPEQDAEALLQHALKLNKFTVQHDQFGDIIAVAEKERTLFNYYRNNILHLFAVPSVLAQLLFHHHQVSHQQCQQQIEAFYPLFAKEWFLPPLPTHYLDDILASFAAQGLVKVEQGQIAVIQEGDNLAQLEMLGKVSNYTLQRYAVVTELISQQQGIAQDELATASSAIATRLGTLHGIKSPEFFDKKVLETLINSLKVQKLVIDQQGKLQATPELTRLNQYLAQLLPARVWQSISNTISQHS